MLHHLNRERELSVLQFMCYKGVIRPQIYAAVFKPPVSSCSTTIASSSSETQP